jgi:hypothetical protein
MEEGPDENGTARLPTFMIKLFADWFDLLILVLSLGIQLVYLCFIKV